MDTYDLRPQPKARRQSPLWNILTLLAMLGICGAAFYFGNLFLHPNSPLNPFPPEQLPTAFRTATFTPTDTPPLPTATLRPGQQPAAQQAATRTKAPTWTPMASDTPKAAIKPPASGTETVTSTPMPASAEIMYGASTSVHADLACKWFGVGGKVVDPEGAPIAFQTVQLSGKLNGKAVNSIVLSGHDPLPAYGPAGFEFKLGDAPVDSTQELWIQLFDNGGLPLTEKIYFDTFNDCKKNLVMIVFTKNR